jgi:hypothetical protein
MLDVVLLGASQVDVHEAEGAKAADKSQLKARPAAECLCDAPAVHSECCVTQHAIF